MTSIGETISRIRNLIKAVKEDAFITDRFLYSVILKHGKALIRRQDNENKVMRMSMLFERIPCTELIEIDKIDDCCGVDSGCIIRKTKEKLPEVLEGAFGPLIRSVSSIDGSTVLIRTSPTIYNAMSKSTSFKYNKNKYYWYLDGHLYFPNIDWDAVSIEAIFTESIGHLTCSSTEQCEAMQYMDCPIPDYLFTEVETLVLKDLGLMIQIPQDQNDNQQNILRS
jgi:hypothetical protein